MRNVVYLVLMAALVMVWLGHWWRASSRFHRPLRLARRQAEEFHEAARKEWESKVEAALRSEHRRAQREEMRKRRERRALVDLKER